MCIAILNKKRTISTATLNRCWDNNPEGAGILWSEGGKVKTFKTFDPGELVKTYHETRARIKTPIVLHFRISTSGKHNTENLHPFTVSNTLAFVHNGVIFGLGDTEHSDTHQFNEKLKSLPENFLHCATIRELIAAYIDNSKLVFLTGEGEPVIINEHLGTWDEGDWYSNASYKDDRFYYYGSTKIEKASYKKTKPTPAAIAQAPTTLAKVKPSKWDEQQNVDFLRSYFTEVNAANVRAIAAELDMHPHEAGLIWEIEDKAREHGTYSLTEILHRMQYKTGRNTYASYTWDDWNDRAW